MKTSKIVYWVIVLVIIVGGWYLYSRTTPPPASPSTNVGLKGSSGQTNTGQQAAVSILNVSTDQKLGTYLVDANGMTLYTYSRDTDVSNCTDDCAANWPPYILSGNEPMVVGDGVDGSKVSTLARADGSLQFTYQGAPLYTYVKDTQPGDLNGQNVGGTWFIVKP